MSSKLKVFIVGATGITGQSIAHGLLAKPEQFDLHVLARSASLAKPELSDLTKLGATLQAVDLDGPVDAVAELLAGADVVISCLTLLQFDQEIKLVSAAKQAGVGRYVPSFFGPVAPPNPDVLFLRAKKEEILLHAKSLYLPYTVIDIGWWYQMVAPRPPSEAADPNAFVQPMPIIGDGDVKIGLTDNRDIGNVVAKVIADKRTINRSVFFFGEVATLSEVWNVVEEVSGVTINNRISSQSIIDTVTKFPREKGMTSVAAMAHYYYTLAVRGDNVPEKARYLGYLDARELYPDLQRRPWKEYVEDLVAGKLASPYSGRGRIL